jgi:uncharacterized protein (DUF302 family)
MSSKLTPNRRGGLRDFPGGGYPERSLLIALERHDPANAAARCESYRNGGNRMTTKESPWSVEETVSRLQGVLESKGIKLFAVIDHSGEAEAVGLELRNTKLVIFGNPLAGTPVMAAAPLAALDLPLKVLVWADGDQTKLSYAEPAELAERYGLSDELAGRLAAIDAVTDAVIER